ncbi:MAG: type II secretion system GspH family protein [Campylobacter sp.]|nr:type II secretion system GspH family protein [Campylobacter sp.]
MQKQKILRAFSLLELVISIVLLGIFASFGTNLIFSIYENHYYSKTINQVQSELTNATDAIAKMLRYRINDGLIMRQDDRIQDIKYKGQLNYNMIEFVTYSAEAFEIGAYSGFADLNASKMPVLKSPDSNFTKATEVFEDIFAEGNYSFNKNKYELALVFASNVYDAENSFGFNGFNDSENSVVLAKIKDKENLELENFSGKIISEHYHILSSAYAIKFDEDSKDLWLYFNYRPWLGETYEKASRTRLLNNVTAFKFKEENGMIYIKICAQSGDMTKPFCAIKAI